MPDHISIHIPGAPGAANMIAAKSTIERQATEAAAKGLSINDSCPYPFGSPAADHFKAVYLLTLPLAREVASQGATKGCHGTCTQACKRAEPCGSAA